MVRMIRMADGDDGFVLPILPTVYSAINQHNLAALMSSSSSSEAKQTHVLVVGAGAVGCFYASKLHHVRISDCGTILYASVSY